MFSGRLPRGGLFFYGHAAPYTVSAISFRISETLHAVHLGPSFTGAGNFLSFTPFHQVLRDTG
jgi:hypothetical protein